jgi:Fe2+ or Zn2+ uptake regulation protein
MQVATLDQPPTPTTAPAGTFSSPADSAFPAPAPLPSLKDLTARLRRSGLRLTPGRQAMLGTLLRCNAPISLTQLQVAIRPQRVALATLFRSMHRMEEVELVTRTIDLHGTALWSLNLGRPRAFHLTRRDTGEIDALDQETARPLAYLLAQIEQRLRQRGYTRLQLSVAFRGSNPLATAQATRQHVA